MDIRGKRPKERGARASKTRQNLRQKAPRETVFEFLNVTAPELDSLPLDSLPIESRLITTGSQAFGCSANEKSCEVSF